MMDSEQPDPKPVPARTGEGEFIVFPVTVSQRRFWLLDALNPGNPALNMPVAVRITGCLDPHILEQAVNKVIARHEVLRTSYRTLEDEVMQVIRPEASIRLRQIDLTTLAPREQEAELKRSLSAEAEAPFSLVEGPALRATLIKLSEDQHVLALTLHHIASDGWSCGVLVKEIAEQYAAATTGTFPPDPTLQYADFAHWQQEWLTGPAAEEQRQYWAYTLGGTLPVLNLPTDHPRRPGRSYAGENRTLPLPKDLVAQLRALANREDLTLFMVFLGAYGILLHRYTGHRDIVIGSPAANRGQTELEGVIGLFSNPLVLRLKIPTGSTARSILHQVKDVSLGAFAHQSYPFDLILDQVQPDPTRSGLQWLQVYFLFQKSFVETQRLPGLTFDPIPSSSPGALFEWTFGAIESQQGIQLELEYNSGLFSPATIDRFFGHFLQVLKAIVSQPGVGVDDIALLTAQQRQGLLDQTVGPTVTFPTSLRVHELFEARAKQTPESLAVIQGGQALTYAQLNANANRLARVLRSRGASPGTFVGLFLDPDSIGFLIGLLATLKAGAGFVAIDSARLSASEESLTFALLLTNSRCAAQIPKGMGPVLDLDDDADRVAAESDSDLSSIVLAEQPACIWRNPEHPDRQGVVVSHRALLSQTQNTQTEYQVRPEDRVLLPAEESLSVLVFGGCVILRQRDSASTDHLPSWLQAIAAQRPTVVVLTTPVWNELAWKFTAIDREGLSRLRLMIIGGTAASPSALAAWTQYLGDRTRILERCRFEENSGAAGFSDLLPTRRTNTSCGVGRAASGTHLQLLDGHLQPVPAGVVGDLYVGGMNLASGYLNGSEGSPIPTVRNPLSERASELLARTHYRGRFVPGIGLELLGCIEDFAKTPGFTLELSEIRSCVFEHPQVWDALLLPNLAEGRAKIVLYVVCKSTPAPTEEALKAFVSERLPAYMAPTQFVILERFPLDPNGWVDVRALLQTRSASATAKPEPGKLTPTENALCLIWAEVFRREKVSPDESFFELGGDSIITLQIASRATQVGIRVSPKQVWQCKTVRGLASMAELSTSASADQGLVAGAVPLLPVQHWFFEHRFEEQHHWNQAVLLEPLHAMDVALLKKAFQALVLHHDALRLRFDKADGVWHQSNQALDSHEHVRWIDLSSLPGVDQDKALSQSLSEIQASLNLSSGPLIRAAYYHFGVSRPARLLIAIHHLAVDGVSWRILLEDLRTALTQLLQRRTVMLPLKTTSYQEWAKRLVEYVGGEAIQNELTYWRSLIRTSPFKLPADSQEDADTVAAAQEVTTRLSQEETSILLRQLPSRYQAQILDALLWALASVLGEWTDEREVAFDLEGHGREDILPGIDLSRTVGWFTTMYPVALKVDPSLPIGESLRTVQEQLKRIPGKGLGFGLLRYLSGNRQTREALGPLCRNRVIFNYLGQLDQVGDVHSLFRQAWEPCGDSRSAKGHLTHELEINAFIAEDCLNVSWTFSGRRFRQASIETISSRFNSALMNLIAEVRAEPSTPSSEIVFPLLKLSREQIAGLSARYPGAVDAYPLSPMQQLFHSLSATRSSVGCEQFRFVMRGALNTTWLKRGWELLLERHAVLRTAFVSEGLPEPAQVVCSRVSLLWCEADWRHLNSSEQAQSLELLLQADRRKGYDPSIPPLTRFHLLHLTDESWCLVWSFHHLLLDGWSWPLLHAELVAIYDALAAGTPAKLPPRVPYRNYIQWLENQDLKQAKQFWTDELMGFEAPTPLGFLPEYPEADKHGDLPLERRTELSAELSSELISLCRLAQISLSTVIEGAWALALAHRSKKETVVFGVTVSGRPAGLPEAESIVGMFINNIPRRVDVILEEDLESWLRKLHGKQLEANEFENTSLFQIREWSRMPGRFRLFNSLILFQNYRQAGSETSSQPHVLRDAEVRAEVSTMFPLTLVVSPGKALGIQVIADPTRIRPEGADHYLTLVVHTLKQFARFKDGNLAELLDTLPQTDAAHSEHERATATELDLERVLPRTETEQALAQIWQRVLGISTVGVTDNFFDLGGHSLPAVSLFRDIQKIWKKNLPLVTLFKAPTIEQLAAIIEGKNGSLTWKSLVPLKPEGTKPPFYCVHGVGGNILEFSDMVPYVARDQPLYGIQAQGLDGKTARHTSVEQMASHYVKEIREFQPVGPYFLGGASFGGLVALEIAQQLLEMGEVVGILVMFDSWAPGHPKFIPTIPGWKKRFDRVRLRVELHWSNLQLSGAGERTEYFFSKVSRLRKRWRLGLASLMSEFRERIQPLAIRSVRRAGHLALARYQPRPYRGKITLMRATMQPRGIVEDLTNGWSSLALEGVEVHDVPGHHGSLMRKPRTRKLIEKLTICLEAAQAQHQSRTGP